jgi:hypothetical protein
LSEALIKSAKTSPDHEKKCEKFFEPQNTVYCGAGLYFPHCIVIFHLSGSSGFPDIATWEKDSRLTAG